MSQIITKFITNSAVTNAKLANMADLTVKANKSGGAASPSDLTLSNVTEAGSAVLTISNGSNAVVAIAPLTIQLNLANADFYVGNASNFPVAVAMSGDATLANTGAVTLGSHVVSNAKFRQSGAQSVVGNSTNATADVADISASAANQILRANGAGTALAFGSIDLAASGAVGLSILNVANGGTGSSSFTAYSVVCAGTATTGPFQNVSGVGTSGQVLTSNGAAALPTWQASGGSSPTSNYFSGYVLGSAGTVLWTTTSGSFVDGTNSGGNALTTIYSNGLTVTAAAGNVCGITFTPSNSANVYQILAVASFTNSGTSNDTDCRMTDGTTNLAWSTYTQPTGGGFTSVPLNAIYAPGTTSAVTVKLQLAASAGTAKIMSTNSGNTAAGQLPVVSWTVTQIK